MTILRAFRGQGATAVSTYLRGVSIVALLAGGGTAGARSLNSLSNISPTSAASAAQLAAAAQAAAAAQQSEQSLARAAAALQAARAAQQSARSLSSTLTGGIPDGLAKGGLMPADGIAADPTLWQGAGAPIQAVANGRTLVDIQQTQQKAILNWKTFNVGRNTTLNFDQQANDWTVLNRVSDPSAAPSTILGQITAKGGVYIINQNGIIFGGGSQINVHALVASDLDVGTLGQSRYDRDQFFLGTGIANGTLAVKSFSIGGEDKATTAVGGGVVVQAGAAIQTDDPGADKPGGFAYLFGSNVANYGSINVPNGEAALVSGRAIFLTPNQDAAANFPSAVLPANVTFRGTGFQLQQYASKFGFDGTPIGPYLSGTGSVANNGLIETRSGIVEMAGDRVSIGAQGVVSADTSITLPSMVLLHAATSVDLSGTISILPFDTGATLPRASSAGSNVQSFMPAYVEATAQGQVTVESSGLVSAPSASVSINVADMTGTAALQGRSLFAGVTVNPTLSGPQRVLLAPGATIDVAGLQNVELPASYNFISISPTNEFADMPLQRPPYVSVGSDGKGVVYGQALWIDIRASGTRSDGTTWLGTPLFDANTAVGNVGRSIFQLMTSGGNVSLTTPQVNAPGQEVVLQPGSVINTAGGSIRYLPGTVPVTILLGSDGRRYSMQNADPDMTYLGIAGMFTSDHPRWNVKEIWNTNTTMQVSGYVEGQDAGGVAVSTVTPLLGGTLLFGSVPGERQIGSGNIPSQGSLTLTTASTVVIGANAASPPADFDARYNQNVYSADGTLIGKGAALPPQNPTNATALVSSDNLASTSAFQTLLSADQLSGYGLSALSITSNDLVVTKGSTLRLAPGGQLSVTTGGAIDVAGTVAAAGGKVNLKTDGYGIGSTSLLQSLFKPSVTLSGATMPANVFVSGVLDVSGQWTNDRGRFGNDASGPAYINGGTIAISTNKNSSGTLEDTTGSILLTAGSLLDVSSGGYISPLGTPKTVSSGLMAGAAGGISLKVYQGKQFSAANNPEPPLTPTTGTIAVLQLDGAMRAYGFADSGTLTLGAAGTITIGNTSQPDSASGIRIGGTLATLPASLFANDGFGAFVLQSAPSQWAPNGQAASTGTIVVAAGTTLTLRKQSLSSLADYSAVPTGSKLATMAPLVTVQDGQRTPVNLTLKSDNILLDAGATIQTDPGAIITIAGAPTFQGMSTETSQRATSVLLRGSIIDHSGTVSVNATSTWLDQNASIDLSGILRTKALFGSRGGPAVSGTVLPGGNLIVEAADPASFATGTNPNLSGTALVAMPGAKVDVSGAAATLLVANSGDVRPERLTSMSAWSDAGSVSIDAGAFVWGGNFVARAIDPRAHGGTLMLGGAAISLRQDSTDVTAALSKVGQASLANLSGMSQSLLTQLSASTGHAVSIVAAADSSRLGAFDDVFLYSGTSAGGPGRIFTDLPGSTYNVVAPNLVELVVDGTVDFNVASRMEIAASSIRSVTPGSATPQSAVTLAAPYVLLTGGFPNGNGTTSAGTSTLVVKDAQTIDVEGAAFSGFSSVRLSSSGDIRLSTPKVADGLVSGVPAALQDTTTFRGFLDSSGDLALDAQRIYPVSSVDFFIRTPKSVTFSASAGSNPQIPLSAGGSISVYAASIEQGGNLFAPLGKITLGDDGSAARNSGGVVTTKIALVPGSLTSVTLADTLVPYGETADGTNWFYNASLYPLEAHNADGSAVVLPNGTSPVLPSKGLVLNSANVTVASGAKIDLRGGGDLQSMEFVKGKGGSRDALATTPAGQTVYALLPSRNNGVAAFDIHFTTARSLDGGNTITAGDAYPLAGEQIYIDGGNGIPAGSYTLYPGHYATLPGALRVVDYGSNVGKNLASGTALPDGTVLTTGYYTSSTRPGTRSAGQELFAVQTGAVWKQYSEYTLSTANSYFAAKAQHDGVMVPRLPVDAGRIAAIASQSLDLAGTIAAHAAPNGRGGELDVSASKLVVSPTNPIGVEPTYASGDGWIWLSADQLNALGLESVLLGGLRTDTAGGNTLITPTAGQVTIDTRGTALTVPELVLAAQPANPLVQTVNVAGLGDVKVTLPSAGGGVTIASGSVIETAGTIQSGFGRHYVFASTAPVTAQQIAAYLGGTLNGAQISNADLTRLPLTLPNGRLVGPTQLAALARGEGALFVASNDSSLMVTGPATNRPDLTISFAPVAAAGGAPVTGTINLPFAGQDLIEAGSRISTQTLSLQATGNTNAIVLNAQTTHPGAAPAVLDAKQVNLTAGSIGFERNPSPGRTEALLLSQTNLGQLAGVQSLALKALSGPMTFYGDVAFTPGAAMQNLTLDARTIAGTGGDVRLAIGGTATLVSSSLVSETASTSTSGTFELDAGKIVLGGGTQTIAGFSNINWTAAERLDIAGPGTLALGAAGQAAAVDLNINTPLVWVSGQTGAASGAQFALTTNGTVTITRPGDPRALVSRPDDSSDLGGNIAITAASIRLGEVDASGQPLLAGGIIQAQAGNITLHATSGDVTLNPGAYIAAGGYKKTFVDVTTYAPGGKVVLQSDAGNVHIGENSVVDVAQPGGGLGHGGEIDVTARSGDAVVAGALLGAGGAGLGGSFKLDILGAANLDALASTLGAGGLNGAIDIHTRTGNLVLSAGSTLKANSVVLTADDQRWNGADGQGKVTIAGKIDASGSASDTIDGSGQAGGQVSLYGYNAVVLNAGAQIDASTAHGNERGGDVVLGIGTNAAGYIDLQGGNINVSGPQGGVGGTIRLRAPIIPGSALGHGDVRIAGLNSSMTGARAVIVEPYVTLSTDGSIGLNGSWYVWNGIIDPANNPYFFNLVAAYVQGTTVYGFADTFTRLTPLAQRLGAGMVTVQPGLELLNTNKTVNNGDITIASNWNLASGTAYDLKTSGGVTYYADNSSVKLDYRLYPYLYGANVGALFGVSSPGTLTLRTGGNINVNASISDGFFQFGNYLDPTYVTRVGTYLANSQARGMDGKLSLTGQNTYLYQLNAFNPNASVPIAPYNQAANGISPGSDALASADLFPHSLLMCQTYCGNGWGTKVSVVDPGSWSYRFTAGADVASANPTAMQSLGTVASGSVIVDRHTTYNQSTYDILSGVNSFQINSVQVNLATMVRTGTGDISISAARDVVLKDTTAPGTIYSAGVNSARLADPRYQLSGTTVSAQNPDGFLEPQVLGYGTVFNATLYGPPTAAAFPENGGNVNIVAQRDFIGFNTATTSGNQTSFQLFAPWLLAQTELTPVPINVGTRLMGAGVFAPTGTSIASQSAWWIQYSSFQQGVLSAGGNVSLTVGRDMLDVSASLPTTGQVSGGLSNASTPQTHAYGSGNLSVQVGRDLLGGALYEGSGHASVLVRGSVGQAGSLVGNLGSTVNYPLLAVDSGQIALAATGSVTIAGVVNPAAIHSQAGSFGDPLGHSSALYMDTYGPNSGASILAVGGNVTIGVAPIVTFYRAHDLAYPASFEAMALSGDIKTTDMTSVQNSGIVLSGSPTGTFELLAQGTIDLTGGYSPTSGFYRPTFSAGPSLLDTAFNPFRPNDGFDDRLSREVLAHQDDTEVAHIYAMTGDILGAGTVKSSVSNNQVSITDIQRVEINSPAEIHAGRDIVDLNLIVQNIAASDVSKVDAGRDIYYTGYNLAGGLQVAGPGFFVVQAGRDLGPLLPAVHDNANETVMQQGITAVGNASFTPVGNRYVVQASSGMYDPLLLGPTGKTPKQRNPLLARTSADLIVQFGVANGINYDGFWKLDPQTNQPVYYPGVIDAYLNPARGSIDSIVSGAYSALSDQLKQFLATNPRTTQAAALSTYQAASATPAAHNYSSELQSFLVRIGHPAADANAAWTTFQGLSKDLQHVFADQIFYAELKAVGEAQKNSSGNYQRGYQAINTLFPASLGYTANALGGGSNGANQLVATGDLDMLHATIQTQQGGDISIMGPGGNIRVGSLATEPNPLLKLNDLGIMTLAGGSINTFTDQSVRVNSSRVFTEQGGDILMWSSNGDLDAGRGAKTTLSLPPLQIHFDQDDYASTDLGGLVTGAGIAVLQTSSAATTSNLYLLAPRGTVDAGTAGIRASGNLVVAAVQVVNAFNVKVGGSTTGVSTVSVPNLGALSAASNAAGAAAKSAETPTGSGGGTDRASVFIVEVVGYGGGDGSSEASPSEATTSPKEGASPDENARSNGP